MAWGILLVTAALLSACGSSESKSAHCARLTGVEHDECVSELRQEEGRDSTKSAHDKEIEEACELDSKAHQEACETGYRRGLVAEDEEAMGYACEEFESSSDVMLLSACTLGFQQAQGTKRHREEVSPESAGGQLEKVGTITITDHEGTTFRDSYEVGPWFPSEELIPPEDVLEACNTRTQAAIAKGVFVRGAITVVYTEGSYPEFIGLDPEGTISGDGLSTAAVAFERDGEWLCRQEEIPQWEIQAHETQTFPIWLLVEYAESNNNPTMIPEGLNTWHFNPVAPSDLLLRADQIVKGAGAADCYGYHELFLYKSPESCEGS